MQRALAIRQLWQRFWRPRRKICQTCLDSTRKIEPKGNRSYNNYVYNMAFRQSELLLLRPKAYVHAGSLHCLSVIH